MKKFIFIALAASMAFASCVKTETTKNTESVVEVSLPDNVVYTRAIQDPVADQSETAIADVSVFLINSGSNSVVKQVDFEPAEITAQKKRIEDVPAGVDRVIVVANIPSTETAIKTVPTATGVRNYAFSIAEQYLHSFEHGIYHVLVLLLGFRFFIEHIDIFIARFGIVNECKIYQTDRGVQSFQALQVGNHIPEAVYTVYTGHCGGIGYMAGLGMQGRAYRQKACYACGDYL